MSRHRIPFNRPYMTGRELDYMAEAHRLGHLAGDGRFTRKCDAWLQEQTGTKKALLTHSCTGALELAAMLADLEPGDEVILPSFTFVSSANAFARQGATPVFVDIRPDTLNIDETRIEAALTEKTKAIVPVHYAGVACEMDAIMEIAGRHALMVVEDAAQAIFAKYKGRTPGAIGHLGTLSFHETKNIISGEGGALLVNDPELIDRAEIVREKGTNRKAFFRGEVDKYSWVDLGSSLLPSDLIAAFLWAQIEQAEDITRRRRALWQAYYVAFEEAESNGLARRPVIPEACEHNAHLFYLLLPTAQGRDRFIDRMKARGIQCVFHYVPLHSSAMGRKLGRTAGGMGHTDDLSARLVRLPLWIGLEDHQPEVIDATLEALAKP